MKQLREIVGKGKLEDIIKFHRDAQHAAKKRSDERLYHSTQMYRAERDKVVRDQKGGASHVDITKKKNRLINLEISRNDGKRAKEIKTRIDAKGKKK